MSAMISWQLEVNIKPGQGETFRALMEEMVARVRTHEPGTVHYTWFMNPDHTQCHIRESYADSDAALTHMYNYQLHFADRFMDCVQPTRMIVYGSPSEALRAAWDPNMPIFEQFGGF